MPRWIVAMLRARKQLFPTLIMYFLWTSLSLEERIVSSVVFKALRHPWVDSQHSARRHWLTEGVSPFKKKKTLDPSGGSARKKLSLVERLVNVKSGCWLTKGTFRGNNKKQSPDYKSVRPKEILKVSIWEKQANIVNEIKCIVWEWWGFVWRSPIIPSLNLNII